MLCSQGVVSITLVMPQFLEEFPEIDSQHSGASFKKGLLTAMIELGAFLGKYTIANDNLKWVSSIVQAVSSKITWLTIFPRGYESRLDRGQDLAQVVDLPSSLHLPRGVCSADRLCQLRHADWCAIHWRYRCGHVSPPPWPIALSQTRSSSI